MMAIMETVSIVVLVIVVAVLAAVAGALVESARRRAADDEAHAGEPSVDEVVRTAVADAVAELRLSSASERDAAIQAALEHSAVLHREQVGTAAEQARQQTSAELGAKHDLIADSLGKVQAAMSTDLDKLSAAVAQLADSSTARFAQVDQSLKSHAEITQTLSESARALREAMASPTARGQWGERMAEDVLRLGGMVENVNYVKQSQLDGSSGRPDFTFWLPKGHELYMDVKFPMAAYLRYLEATSDAERSAHRADFVRDVKARVRELAKRDYARESHAPSVDYVVMFLPNEQLSSFIFESDPTLIDEAMAQRVVMCSPVNLFALLGVIRKAHDNFMIEQTSQEILALIGKFNTEWDKYSAQLDTLKRRFDSLDKAFDEVIGVRRRALEKPLRQLDSLRVEHKISLDGPVMGQLGEGVVDSFDTDA
ncbi:MAG: hypothetical protein CSA55_03760 [Ilumatobacter coccineus]|uniref:DNA recombination protein RmuC n=1 Tax=Ilumatobacter coccineus TaxID=467094 RepID=A0A2G6K9C2_9ACTN|nr:MAG: hypothetical protein CSA55_03760 [Ilumatobacter coccineus]